MLVNKELVLLKTS